MFLLSNDEDPTERKDWLRVSMYAAGDFTKFTVQSPEEKFTANTVLFYPYQWTRICLSYGSKHSLVALVVDGKQLVANVIKVAERPRNLTLILGSNGDSVEMTGRITSLNMFSSALSIADMQNLTTAGEKMCGAPGDFLSWKKINWTLHSKARIIDIDGASEGPCRRKSKVQVFPLEGYQNQGKCMELCQKLGGRSPSVKTHESWEYLFREDQHISSDPRKLPDYIWLAATEGNEGSQLSRQENWPEGIEAQDIPDICHGRADGVRVNFFWPV